MSDKPILFLAADHAGFALKSELRKHLASAGYEVRDCGADTFEEKDDYPDFIARAAEEISKNPLARAIVIGASGQGEAMVANRVKGVRAAVYYGGPLDIIRLSREHNDANALSLGARFLTVAQAKEAVDLWLATPFSGEERHVRRIGKLDQ